MVDLHALNLYDSSFEIIPWFCSYKSDDQNGAIDIDDSNNRGYGDEYFAPMDDEEWKLNEFTF